MVAPVNSQPSVQPQPNSRAKLGYVETLVYAIKNLAIQIFRMIYNWVKGIRGEYPAPPVAPQPPPPVPSVDPVKERHRKALEDLEGGRLHDVNIIPLFLQHFPTEMERNNVFITIGNQPTPVPRSSCISREDSPLVRGEKIATADAHELIPYLIEKIRPLVQ